ncbi:dodecin family protein [Halobium palmae]|uniref:Dodecin family protein n=1 Tax=Halobium palmae TaxID=1776492 RepID=A0ABD5RZ39_9EURY
MTAIKVIKVIGTSAESWEDAAREAVRRAGESVDDVRGIEIEKWTATVEDDDITEYKVTSEIAFPVREREQ